MNATAKGDRGTKLALVLGGTGKTGRRVVSRLKERGLPVRTGSRNGTPPFNWEAPGSWAPALDGVGVRIISQTGIHYRNGPLSETLGGIPHSTPRAGDRFPWLRLNFQASG